VNEAYEVEAFFVAGDRTHADEVGRLIDLGQCLVAETDDGLQACVHLSVQGDRGYFGMLAVRPEAQGRGLGQRLIVEVERCAQRAGCQAIDIKVVNLRTDLIAFYERRGYRPVGAEPYVHRPVLQPCHFVVMTKSL
jgi:GNAT superfamily N-acetyltransferase